MAARLLLMTALLPGYHSQNQPQSSTVDPRDAFLQAIGNAGNDISNQIQPFRDEVSQQVQQTQEEVQQQFRDFDRDPQATRPTIRPTAEPRFPSQGDNRANIFSPPVQDFRPAIRVQVDDFGKSKKIQISIYPNYTTRKCPVKYLFRQLQVPKNPPKRICGKCDYSIMMEIPGPCSTF